MIRGKLGSFIRHTEAISCACLSLLEGLGMSPEEQQAKLSGGTKRRMQQENRSINGRACNAIIKTGKPLEVIDYFSPVSTDLR
jgi:hypothetical protein